MFLKVTSNTLVRATRDALPQHIANFTAERESIYAESNLDSFFLHENIATSEIPISSFRSNCVLEQRFA